MHKTVTNQQLVDIFNRITAFIEKDKVTPGKVSYAITRNYKALERAIEPLQVEQKKMLKKIDDANADETLDDAGKKQIVEDMNAAYKEMLETEIELDIHTVSEDMVVNMDNMTAKDYLALDFMIDETSTKEESHPVPTPVE